MENKNKQTAVEWLENQLKTRPKPLDNSQIDKLFEQAKQMEKQQIMDAWDDGNDTEMRGGKYKRIIKEKYYNEEYGK